MALFFKPGVTLRGLKAETVLGLVVAEQVFAEYGYDCTVTSGTDSHPAESVHGQGYAVDLRTRDMDDETALAISGSLRNRLPNLYDVVLENNPRHLHLEVDPKTN